MNVSNLGNVCTSSQTKQQQQQINEKSVMFFKETMFDRADCVHVIMVKFLWILCLWLTGFQAFQINVGSSFKRHIIMAKGFGSTVDVFKYSGTLRPGELSPKRHVPPHIPRPDYAISGSPKRRKASTPWDFPATSENEIANMRVACRLAREVLDEAVRMIRPGITTDDIDKLVHEKTIQRDSYPSTLNYGRFPKSCCTSINEVVCHGIPDSTVLKDGDIINIDVTLFHNGVHGDCSETVLVGENVDPKVKDLVHTTYLAWNAAIQHCKPGVPYNELGGIIDDIIEPKGYSSMRDFCGHGINSLFHCHPSILHYRNSGNYGVMQPGHTFTIEPMICLGSVDYITWKDKWTVATADGLPSAQFEHTLLITDTGVDILTAKLPDSPKYFWEK